MDLLLHFVEHALEDTLSLVPFLFVTYLVLEALEHAAGNRVNATVRRAGKIIVIDSRHICRSVDGEVRTLPRESAPASLQNWARRRGTLAADENELHLGLDDTDLMLRTVQAEFNGKGMFLK